MLTIGTQLRRIRLERRLTHRQLSERSGVAIAIISRLENNHQEPEAETMAKLADCLGVPMDALRDRPETAESSAPSELEASLMAAAQRAKGGDQEALAEMRRLYAELARADAARGDSGRSQAALEPKTRRIPKS